MYSIGLSTISISEFRSASRYSSLIALMIWPQSAYSTAWHSLYNLPFSSYSAFWVATTPAVDWLLVDPEVVPLVHLEVLAIVLLGIFRKKYPGCLGLENCLEFGMLS